jgi:hypothetical protein
VFETVLSEVLFGVSEARRKASRPSLDGAGCRNVLPRHQP